MRTKYYAGAAGVGRMRRHTSRSSATNPAEGATTPRSVNPWTQRISWPRSRRGWPPPLHSSTGPCPASPTFHLSPPRTAGARFLGLASLDLQPEPQGLGRIKETISRCCGMLDLLVGWISSPTLPADRPLLLQSPLRPFAVRRKNADPASWQLAEVTGTTGSRQLAAGR